MLDKDYLEYHFFYKRIRAKICILAITHALITDAENPVISTIITRNIRLIAFILRFETFNLFRLYVIPISTIPNMCA